MTRVVWKYELASLPHLGKDRTIEITMPEEAAILACAEQHSAIKLWALVDPAAPPQRRQFVIYETGRMVDDGAHLAHVETLALLNGTYTLHVFERLS